MNKRQRKKRLKKIMDHMSRVLRETLDTSFIGDAIKSKLAQPSFIREIFVITPILRPPYRQWRMLGANQLTHHVGTNPSDNANYHWVRFCDYGDAPEMYLLSHEAPVDCLQCIAREEEVHANARD